MKKDAGEGARRGTPLPTWDGELYLELHRGTLTTQAWIKEANRRAEDRLLLAEALWAGSMDAKMVKEIDELWEILLLNQFHDILPGSSIGWVYEDARKQFEELTDRAEAVIAAGIARSRRAAGTGGIVVNPSSLPRAEVVESEAGVRWVDAPVSVGVAPLKISKTLPEGVEPVRGTDSGLSNGLVEMQLDERGEVKSLRSLWGGKAVEVCARGERLNTLAMYEDRPHMWDAWDIDAGYENREVNLIGAVAEIEARHYGDLRAEIRTVRRIGEKSELTQTYRLDAGSPRIDVVTSVRWNESHKLLRALFPTNIRASEATYEIQFGVMKRPTHRNTSWDAAKFEVCGHRFMDLSMPGRGLAILNDCKYGFSCHGGVMGMSLLRAPTHPDPTADRHGHVFTYSMLPHAGDWVVADVLAQAESLNRPLRVTGKTNGVGKQMSLIADFGSSGAGDVVLSGISSRERKVVQVRLYEATGADAAAEIVWSVPVKRVRVVDFLGKVMKEPRVVHKDNVTSVQIAAFKIVTLEVTLA